MGEKSPHNGKLYRPTPDLRRQVLTLIGLGIRQEDVAKLLEIHVKTLRVHFRRELDTGAIEANSRVAKALYRNATVNDNVAAQIWWTKTRMGWKEEVTLNGTLAVGGVDLPPRETLEQWLTRRRQELNALEATHGLVEATQGLVEANVESGGMKPPAKASEPLAVPRRPGKGHAA
jgi:hypothetical protein